MREERSMLLLPRDLVFDLRDLVVHWVTETLPRIGGWYLVATNGEGYCMSCKGQHPFVTWRCRPMLFRRAEADDMASVKPAWSVVSTMDSPLFRPWSRLVWGHRDVWRGLLGIRREVKQWIGPQFVTHSYRKSQLPSGRYQLQMVIDWNRWHPDYWHYRARCATYRVRSWLGTV